MITKPKTKGEVHRLTVDLPAPLMGWLEARKGELGASYQAMVVLAVQAYAANIEANRLGDPVLIERARALLGQILTGHPAKAPDSPMQGAVNAMYQGRAQ